MWYKLGRKDTLRVSFHFLLAGVAVGTEGN